MSRCVDLRRSMCRLSKIDVSTFEDGCVDLRIPMIDVSTFEDRRLMCRPSKFDSRCVDLRTSMVNVKFGCYTCSKYLYYSCMRITPRVCTSVLSLFLVEKGEEEAAENQQKVISSLDDAKLKLQVNYSKQTTLDGFIQH